MDTPYSPSLKGLTEDVQRDLAGLYANLRKSPYKDNALKSLHPAVIKLCDLIREELSNHPQHPLERGVRQSLSSLRSVQGSMQLIISASKDYASTQGTDEKHKHEETWISREIKLADQADLCVQSLELVLAFADDLDSRAAAGDEPGEEPKAG